MCQEAGSEALPAGAPRFMGNSGSMIACTGPCHDEERGGARPGRAATSILVEVDDPKMGLLRFIALENYLSDLLGVKVDLVEKQTLKPAIGRHMTKEVECI